MADLYGRLVRLTCTADLYGRLVVATVRGLTVRGTLRFNSQTGDPPRSFRHTSKGKSRRDFHPSASPLRLFDHRQQRLGGGGGVMCFVKSMLRSVRRRARQGARLRSRTSPPCGAWCCDGSRGDGDRGDASAHDASHKAEAEAARRLDLRSASDARDTKIAHKPLTIAHYSHLICAP